MCLMMLFRGSLFKASNKVMILGKQQHAKTTSEYQYKLLRFKINSNITVTDNDNSEMIVQLIMHMTRNSQISEKA